MNDHGDAVDLLSYLAVRRWISRGWMSRSPVNSRQCVISAHRRERGGVRRVIGEIPHRPRVGVEAPSPLEPVCDMKLGKLLFASVRKDLRPATWSVFPARTGQSELACVLGSGGSPNASRRVGLKSICETGAVTTRPGSVEDHGIHARIGEEVGVPADGPEVARVVVTVKRLAPVIHGRIGLLLVRIV